MRLQKVLSLSVGMLICGSCGSHRGVPQASLSGAKIVGAQWLDLDRSDGSDDAEPLIVGGRKVTATDVVAKSTVSLLDAEGWQFCTGSLIARRTVLTAAHCLRDYHSEGLFIGFGVSAVEALAVGKHVRKASRFVLNPGFDTEAIAQTHPSRPPNDLAVVHLAEEAPVGFVPAIMMGAKERLKIGERLTLVGFGLTKAVGGTSGILRKVHTKLVQVVTANGEIEFGGIPGRSACMGDSGGPAFVKRRGVLKLVGVTSRGSPGCVGDGIYTDVRQFQAWISNQLPGESSGQVAAG